MDWYQIASTILAEVRDCFGNGTPDCTYEYFVSLGAVPADCSSISINHIKTTVGQGKSSKCLRSATDQFELVVTKCCLSEGDAFSAVLEDQNAKCFLDDFGDIFECLVCNLEPALKQWNVSCGVSNVAAGVTAPIIEGGCYSASITIVVDRLIGCCA